MRKSDYYFQFLMLGLIIFGIWLKNYWGGFIGGFSLTLILIVYLGKYQAAKAVKLLEKHIKDSIVNHKNLNDE